MLKRIYYALIKKFITKPIYLIHFITNKCNLKCAHCFYSKEINIKGKEDLSLKEIKKFSKQLGELVWLSFSGGEPFMRPDIDQIYKIYLRNNKVKIFNCPTNGMLTDIIVKKTEEMLKLGGPKNFSINLSLDGLENTHNTIRDLSCFNNVLKTYDGLVKLREKYPWLLIKLNTVITNKNLHEIEKLHFFVKKRMPEINFHSFDIIRGTPKDSNVKTPTIEELNKLKSLLYKIWNSYSFYGKKSFESKIANNTTKILFETCINILKTNKQPFPCYAGKVHCVLDNNGDISLCELLPKIGNIKSKSFIEVWDSKVAKKQKQSIKNKSCTCTHLCFQNTNFMFRLRNWPKMLFSKIKP